MSTSYDDALTVKRDATTDPLYQFNFASLEAAPLVTDAVWICKRITLSNGSKSFADGITDFSDESVLMTVAECLAATYAI